MRALAILLVLLALSGCIGSSKDGATPAATSDNVTAAKANTSVNGTMPDMPNMTMGPLVELKIKLAGIYPANPTFDPPQMEVKSGSMVKVTFTNSDLNPLGSHNWKLDKVAGAETKVVGQGGSETITFTAPAPGTYAYFCNVPGHRGLGMEGKLIVK